MLLIHFLPVRACAFEYTASSRVRPAALIEQLKAVSRPNLNSDAVVRRVAALQLGRMRQPLNLRAVCTARAAPGIAPVS